MEDVTTTEAPEAANNRNQASQDSPLAAGQGRSKLARELEEERRRNISLRRESREDEERLERIIGIYTQLIEQGKVVYKDSTVN